MQCLWYERYMIHGSFKHNTNKAKCKNSMRIEGYICYHQSPKIYVWSSYIYTGILFRMQMTSDRQKKKKGSVVHCRWGKTFLILEKGNVRQLRWMSLERFWDPWYPQRSSDYVRASEAFEEEENEHPTMGSQTRTPEMLHNLWVW